MKKNHNLKHLQINKDAIISDIITFINKEDYKSANALISKYHIQINSLYLKVKYKKNLLKLFSKEIYIEYINKNLSKEISLSKNELSISRHFIFCSCFPLSLVLVMNFTMDVPLYLSLIIFCPSFIIFSMFSYFYFKENRDLKKIKNNFKQKKKLIVENNESNI